MDISNLRTYHHLTSLETFEERFEYLKLSGGVGYDTFGYNRYLNQQFYKSKEWKKIREYVISRDIGCDLGYYDRPITGRIYIHHMNPISEDDIINSTDILMNPEYLICVSQETHNAIHYGTINSTKDVSFVERKPGDTSIGGHQHAKH